MSKYNYKSTNGNGRKYTIRKRDNGKWTVEVYCYNQDYPNIISKEYKTKKKAESEMSNFQNIPLEDLIGHNIKTVEDNKEIIEQFTHSEEEIKRALNYNRGKVKFLESIYMTGEKNNHYSDLFNHIAHTERRRLCNVTTALSDILRDIKESD